MFVLTKETNEYVLNVKQIKNIENIFNKYTLWSTHAISCLDSWGKSILIHNPLTLAAIRGNLMLRVLVSVILEH